MKIIKPLFLFFLISSFIACNSDDGESAAVNTEPGALVGQWGVISIESEGETTTTTAGFDFKTSFTSTSKNEDLVYTFSVDPNNITFAGNYTAVLTTNIVGQNTTQEQNVPYSQGTTTWELVNGGFLEFGEDVVYIDTSELEVFAEVIINENITKITNITDTEMVFETVLDAKATAAAGLGESSIRLYTKVITRMQKL